ncbi:hypothetical protein HanXRQr2_Chr05g0210801 [Helianthus annuus]|uniref:Uncharacterized protein n=1 Tax=Helianthus annuus TaxID=4232 RepID=A0A9K3IZF8_HELAN|nr:hypothetical protein HanXRQr2_Chr05g0210801 [Helianthus annuus]
MEPIKTSIYHHDFTVEEVQSCCGGCGSVVVLWWWWFIGGVAVARAPCWCDTDFPPMPFNASLCVECMCRRNWIA